MHGPHRFPIIAGMFMLRLWSTHATGQTRPGRRGRPVSVFPLRASALLAVAALWLALATMPAQAQSAAPQLAAQAMPSAEGCPDLSPYYPNENTNWLRLEREMAPMMADCLRSSEYFALYGAAQMNSGQVGAAVESLERALLLDPDNGAARIDYAQALFLQGQLFPALDLNRQLLAREDLPDPLESELRQRQREWRDMTVERGGRAEVLVGHDSNLNRGPSNGEITLTLAGESIDLVLGEDFQPIRGVYSNLRLSGFHTTHSPGHSDNWLVELGGRVSEDSRSDITQLNTRYARAVPGRERSWQFGGAVSHLGVGGTSLFTAVEGNLRHQWESRERACNPYTAVTGQQQLYHQDSSHLNAFEARLTGGVNCGIDSNTGIAVEVSNLNSLAVNSGRPGGDRQGWQARLDWQYRLPAGTLSGQITHTRLHDKEGYSPLLEDGARRDLERSYAVLQYRLPLEWGGAFLLNAYHQDQQSNLELFTSRDTALEAGLRFDF
ncbi:MAG: tetratricopeptide repeat protein [Pseudohongiellaceae bacterium]